MDSIKEDFSLESLIESCKPVKKRGRPSHKRQLQEIRLEKRLNLQTADSVLVATNLRSILTIENLQSLPNNCQNLLVKLLPQFDQVTSSEGIMKPTKTALTNEYFVRFCLHYQEKLSENKLSDEAVEQAKNDTSRELAKLDPWKLRNFEPVWGQKLISQTISDEEEDSGMNR